MRHYGISNPPPVFRNILNFYASTSLTEGDRLKDRKAAAIIDARLTRVRMGNLGNSKSVGQGVKELKVDFGPGYRVYFGEDSGKVVVLLIGGDKKTQPADIKLAQQYWADYLEE